MLGAAIINAEITLIIIIAIILVQILYVLIGY